MDCHVFRRLCQELVPTLLGGRMEKIHQPGPDLTMFALYAGGAKRYLFLRAERRDPFLFMASHRIPVGVVPPATIMRLRKHFSGQRLMDARILWTERRLVLRARSENEASSWLDLDLREGPRLHLAPSTPLSGKQDPFAPLDVEPEAAWPNFEDAAGLCLDDRWREWPVLSPALRRTLPLLETAEQAALLADLVAGGGDLFVYGLPDDNSETTRHDDMSGVEISAWPLPEPLRAGRSELVCESALDAVRRVGECKVLHQLAHKAGQTAAKPHNREASRLDNLLHKLEDERGRLSRLAALKDDALALQAELYRFAPEDKIVTVELFSRLGAPLKLDSTRTVRENMADLFHRAGRGARGLLHLEERLLRVRRERETALVQASQAEITPGQAAVPSGKTKAVARPALPKNVQAFRSSDGFLLLRGRDAKGNLALLKLAGPHDLWLHVGNNSAGAHVLVRRDHAGQILPETTLREAGILAALKSERAADSRVEIISALVKYVRPMRAAGRVGTVRMDRVESTWTVEPLAELEATLAL